MFCLAVVMVVIMAFLFCCGDSFEEDLPFGPKLET